MKISRGSSAAVLAEEVYYPDSDGEPMAETEIHVMLILDTIARLRHFFRRRRDVFVCGNMFLYFQKGHPEKRRAPDIMVVKGVATRKKRRSWKVWEEKAVPNAVVEYTSEQTAAEDLGPKKTVYQKLKIREYFLFDPLHDYLPQPLLGYRLVRGVYQPMMPAADGSLVSEELGLRLRPEGDYLGLYDLNTGDRLLPMEDALEALDSTAKQLSKAEKDLEKREKDLEKAEKDLEKREKDLEKVEKDLEEERRRAAALEEELKQLRKSGRKKES